MHRERQILDHPWRRLAACVAAYEALYDGLLDGKTPAEIAQLRYE